MVVQIETSKIICKHLEEIDRQMDHMIAASFEHESIHKFRESVRQFRALTFFYIFEVRSSDYHYVEALTKKIFNMTSLIREIDVFISGYEAYMAPQTLEKLMIIKEPLLEKMISEFDEISGFRFRQIKVRMKQRNPELDELSKHCFNSRHCALFNDFIENEELQFNEEKFIHSKRILAKKLSYIHSILMLNEPALEEINVELLNFQRVSKQLHDVSVNLRFVGKYQLDDQELISKLVKDHLEYVRLAEIQYQKTCVLLMKFSNI